MNHISFPAQVQAHFISSGTRSEEVFSKTYCFYTTRSFRDTGKGPHSGLQRKSELCVHRADRTSDHCHCHFEVQILSHDVMLGKGALQTPNLDWNSETKLPLSMVPHCLSIFGVVFSPLGWCWLLCLFRGGAAFTLLLLLLRGAAFRRLLGVVLPFTLFKLDE